MCHLMNWASDVPPLFFSAARTPEILCCEDQTLKKILILMHANQRRGRGLLIHALGKEWQDRGLQVLCQYGIERHPDADLLIPQIDLTRTPPEYGEYICSYSNVANRNVADISKRRVSDHLLRGDEDYHGPVVVKTDNNFGGLPECTRNELWHLVLSRVMEGIVLLAESALGRHLAWRRVLRKYLVYNNMAEVPPGVFNNRALVVERLLPEKQGNLYFVRHYIFLGDHARSIRMSGSTPILKSSNSTLVDEGLPVPEEVLKLRREMGMDYGKIDYTICNDQVIIIDVNRTPGAPASPARTASDLAGGIWALFPKAGATS